MGNFWRMVNEVIKDSDILLLIADARAVNASMNEEIKLKARYKEKKIIIVINKCDLISKQEYAELQKRYVGAVFVSAIRHLSTMKLLKRIMQVGKGKEVVVGVLGYPNTGKSSVINALKGRKSAPVSSIAGYTRGIQKIKISKKIILIDTPGVIPFKEGDEGKHALIGAKDPNRIKDPESAVYEILTQSPGAVEKYYGVETNEDYDETIDSIALKRGILKKKGVADTTKAARQILFDWQKGKIKK